MRVFDGARGLTAFLLLSCLGPASAFAQTKQACADAYVAGQVARKEGRLRDARARFAVCASSSCPTTLTRDCEPWRTQLDGEIPSLAITVTNDAGAPVPSAVVTVDGAPFSGSGAFDPGDHAVHVEAPGLPSADQQVTLKSGDKGRAITVRLGRGAPPPDTGRPVPVAPIVVGSVGVVALAVFAGLGAAGNSKKSALDASDCKPNCSSSAVSSARSLYLGADVALGLGLGAIATAGVLLIVHFKGGAPAPATTGSLSLGESKPPLGALVETPIGVLVPSARGLTLQF